MKVSETNQNLSANQNNHNEGGFYENDINKARWNETNLNDTDLNEAVNYFKLKSGFRRLFEQMKDKFKSLGVIGGTVELQNLQPEERDALTGLFRKDYTKRKSASIKMENIQAALQNTRFRGLHLEDILKRYFADELISNKDAKQKYLDEQTDFFRSIADKYEGTIAASWLNHSIESKDGAWRIFVQRYDADKEKLLTEIDNVCKGLNNLPLMSGGKVRLPVFASNITSNPHAYDDNTACGQIFLYAISSQFEVNKPRNAEEKAELYYAAGIIFDEVSNYVLCYGLKSFQGDTLHPGWEGFYQSKESLQVSIANLSTVDKVVSPDRTVFAVENAGVFAAILDQLAIYQPSLVCTYGQVKLASLVLLDMLVKEGTTIYYSGDYDPEGLKIADRLKQRYGDNLVLWRYTLQDYEKSLSNETLDVARLKKMDTIKSPQLIELSQHIRQTARAGYQELIISDLIDDIKSRQ